MALAHGDPSHEAHDENAAGGHEPQGAAESLQKEQVVVDWRGDHEGIGPISCRYDRTCGLDQYAVAVVRIIPLVRQVTVVSAAGCLRQRGKIRPRAGIQRLSVSSGDVQRGVVMAYIERAFSRQRLLLNVSVPWWSYGLLGGALVIDAISKVFMPYV